MAMNSGPQTYRAVPSQLVMIHAGVRHPNRKAKPGGAHPDEGWKLVKVYLRSFRSSCLAFWTSKVTQAPSRTLMWKTT